MGEVRNVAERWAKLYAKAGENPDIGELLETEPLTVSLWFLAISRADVYGILPAEPRRFRATVAPAAIIDCATVAQALHSMEERGWIRRYTSDDGVELLHIVRYHEHQDVRWTNRIGPPEYQLPDWWEPPDGFLTALQAIDLTKVRSRKRRDEWTVLLERYGSATVAQYPNVPTQTQTQTQTQRTSTPEGNSREVPVAKEPPPSATDEDLTAPPSNLHILNAEQTNLNNAIRTALRGTTKARHADDWFLSLREFVRDYPEIVTEQALCETLSRDPPKAAERFPDAYMRRVFPACTAKPQQAQAKAGTAAPLDARKEAAAEQRRQEIITGQAVVRIADHEEYRRRQCKSQADRDAWAARMVSEHGVEIGERVIYAVEQYIGENEFTPAMEAVANV